MRPTEREGVAPFAAACRDVPQGHASNKFLTIEARSTVEFRDNSLATRLGSFFLTTLSDLRRWPVGTST